MGLGISELILNGILHLFALLASMSGPSGRNKARDMVSAYLSGDLGIVDITPYLGLFDDFLEFYESETDAGIILSRAGDICKTLRGKLPRTEQYTALLRLFELARPFSTEGESFIQPLAESAGQALGIEKSVISDMVVFLHHAQDPMRLSARLLYVSPTPPRGFVPCRWLTLESFSGGATILHLTDIDTLFISPHPDRDLTLNSIPIRPETFYPVPAGSIIRDCHFEPVCYADLISAVTPQGKSSDITMTGQHVDFCFPGSDNGLHDFCFDAQGGQMIGVMGGSGVGKSTLINILTGDQPPSSGRIRINGLDLYTDPVALEGVIGVVPQDDLLFEELTVYQNLACNTRLCLADLTKPELESRVEETLRELNQWETRDLKVGSPLDKTISGGQRKRLNIALELIREPAVLFVDEPTSGLSSADSLNVISLLKEQSKKNKLIIVIIHQPSSDIFKMFDQLWILDTGGRPVYTGNPIDCLEYFRSEVHQAGDRECLCPRCGSVKPEQIFDILEMKHLDENGYPTSQRRFTPEHWHRNHLKRRSAHSAPVLENLKKPAKALTRPGLFGQMAVFFHRTLMARLANGQYLAVNLLAAPFLAAFIGVITRYKQGHEYVYYDNHHIPVYCFMSVIVALFMGLSVSAEEIIRDNRILKRERFLHLSRFSYINAKVLYLGLIGAVQTGLYVLVGNTILQIPDFSLVFWGILFSCTICASMMGLILSATLKTAVTIYILIPLLLIPQIILGGMVIPFDDLISPKALHNRVPAIGNFMPSRWGFEAAVVALYSHNRFQTHFNEVDRRINAADYFLNYYTQELYSQVDFPFSMSGHPDHSAKTVACLALLKNECDRLVREGTLDLSLGSNAFDPAVYSRATADQIKNALGRVARTFRLERSKADHLRRQIASRRMADLGQTAYQAMEKKYQNRSVVDLVKNRGSLDDYRLAGNRIVRLSAPIFSTDLGTWGSAPFFAGKKRIGPVPVSTCWFNPSVLWGITALLYALLYWQWPVRCFSVGQRLIGHARASSRSK